jgi:hypothetical protein
MEIIHACFHLENSGSILKNQSQIKSLVNKINPPTVKQSKQLDLFCEQTEK